VTGKLNLVTSPAAMEDWIESYPLIVSGLSHWGKASVPTSKILLFQHKVKNDLLFGCLSKKLLTTARLVTTGLAKESDAAHKTSF